MKSTDSQETTSQNSTCRYLGHEWRKAAASNYRICQREKCRAAQRLQDGEWVSVLSQRTRQPHATAQQGSLF
jgi:hypothetical protein